MKYPWILFDADDTLFHFDAWQGLRLMFAAHQLDFGADDYRRYQEINRPLWVEYQNGTISAGQLQTRRFESWARQLGVSAEALNQQFLLAMADTCSLLPGADELLNSLRGQARLGIITNGFTALQAMRLQRCGVSELFDPVVISEQVGYAKPDRRIFEHAFARMGEPPREQILMVGDNPHSDILGGLSAGIHTCWLNPQALPPPADITPHHQVRSLLELRDWLFERD